MALDHSRLGLENKSGEFLRSTSLLYKALPTDLGVSKRTLRFILFIHHIGGETVL